VSESTDDALDLGLIGKPRVQSTHACLVSVDDHLGKSDVMVNTWWNGEGYTIIVTDEKDDEREIDLSHTQWEAVKAAICEISKAERSEP
jgi:hypothetical protein